MNSLASISLMLFLGGACFVAVAVLRWVCVRRRGRTICPGPHPTRWRAADPRRWMARSFCGYDLSASRTLNGGAALCPECGTYFSNPDVELLGGFHRLRTGRIGCVLVAAGAMGLAFQARWNQPLLDRAPSGVLLGVEVALGGRTPADIRSTIRNRAMKSELSPTQLATLVPGLVRDLRDDDQQGNMEDAESVLANQAAPMSMAALEEALDSDDIQQRHAAALLLQSRSMYAAAWTPPSARLLRVSFEMLKDGRLVGYRRSFSLSRSVEFLISCGAGSYDLLLRGIESDDPQERLLCAAISGFTGRTELALDALPVLLSHLQDNRIQGDALYALLALYHFGPSIESDLARARPGLDEQGQSCVDFLLYRLLTPDRQSEVRPPPTPRVTRSVSDPLSLDPRWLDLPEF